MTRPLALLFSFSFLLGGCALTEDFDRYYVDPDSGDGGPTSCERSDTVYVAVNGDDDGDGSLDAPLATIAAAMTMVDGDAGLSRVYLGEGTFETTYETDDEINLADGVTLRGGFSDDFCTYDPTLYVSLIEQKFFDADPMLEIDPIVTPIVTLQGDDLGAGVVLEGFILGIGKERDDNHTGIRLRNTSAVVRDVTVADGDGRAMTGLLVDGAATLTMERVVLAMDNASHSSTGVRMRNVGTADLREVVVERTLADGSLESHGIWAEYDTGGTAYTLSITHSRIHGGRGGSNSNGVRISDSQVSRNPVTAILMNNLIHGGESTSPAYGVRLEGYSRDVSIFNNTIYSGENGGFGYGITYEYDFAGADIRNNLIISGHSSQFCVWRMGSSPWSGSEETLMNNLFVGCTLAALYDGDTTYTDAAAMNALSNVAANQVAASPPVVSLAGPDSLTGTMANNDWGYANLSPCTYTDGAFALPSVTDDYFGDARDATPSIGAVEFMGTCAP